MASGRTLTRSRWWLWVSTACVVTVVVFVGCLGLGTQSIPYSRIIAVVMGSVAGPSTEQGFGDPTSVILLQEANAYTAAMRKQVANLTKKVEGRPRPTLLYVLNSEPLITVGPGSFIHHLIELAGGRNAAERANAPYPRLTMEEVLTQNPDILLFPIGEYEGIPQAEQDRWKRWNTLRAVQEGKLFQVQSDLLNRPGPRVIDGLRHLVKLMHPDVSLDEIVDEPGP